MEHEENESGVLVAVIHSRVQYIGEMLAELVEPKSADELRKAAVRYGLNWDTAGQVNIRRGWLESAGLIEPTDEGTVAITDTGRNLLDQLELYEPTVVPPPSNHDAKPPHASDRQGGNKQFEELAAEISNASTDAGNPERFELAVRDAFNFLGFAAEHLGGPGKTDVLLKAPLGKYASYRVAVDAKTTKSGSLPEHQVDWTTLRDHRKYHDANYSLIVGPNPSAKRLMERATEYKVAVLSAAQLAGLCRQHAHAPVDLKVYEDLFRCGGEVDIAQIDEHATNLVRLRILASALCKTLAEQTLRHGPLTARDILLLLGDAEAGEGSSKEEIQRLLDTLSSPLVGTVFGQQETGYLLASDPQVCSLRIEKLAKELAPD